MCPPLATHAMLCGPLWVLLCGLYASPSRAAASDAADAADAAVRAAGFDPAQAIAPASLADCRGGFTTDAGLAVSIGIERIVTIDGKVAARSQLELGDLGRLASGQSVLPREAAGALSLIQNGTAGLAVQLGSAVLGGTIIQNSLNNQTIAQATIINASVNAQGMLQALNFQSTLSNALTTAATAR